MTDNKVSIVSPCYNVGRFIPRFLESIIDQHYAPIELILVDDGSTDDTAEQIEHYRDRLSAAGIELVYKYKENGGQASAVALGLQFVTGEFLIWPDPDDFLLPNSISHRVKYLRQHLDCGMVRSNGIVYHESDVDKPLRKISTCSNTGYIEDFLKHRIPWCPGCYMIRMRDFDKANPKREIADYRIGQNFQMLIPVAYYYPCHYLDEALFAYVIRDDSHSHLKQSYEKASHRLDQYETCVRDTLAIIPADTSRYLRIHHAFILKSHYRLAWEKGEKADLKKYELSLRKCGEFGGEEWLMKCADYSRVSCMALKGYSAIKRRILKK